MGRPRKPWDISFDEARQRYESGESALQVARACGLATYHPVLRAFRDAGVTIRPTGSPKGLPRPNRRIVRVCRHDGCSTEFAVPPSKDKFYCSPACRYTSGLSRPPLQDNKHRLQEINPDTRRAVCDFCGPTDIRIRTERRKYQVLEPTWRCSTADRIRNWALNYGLSLEAVQQMLAIQGWGCGICQGDLHKKFYVDHDHACCPGDRSCGKCVRGLLCGNCNTGLGLFADNVMRLRRAISYLERDASNAK